MAGKHRAMVESLSRNWRLYVLKTTQTLKRVVIMLETNFRNWKKSVGVQKRYTKLPETKRSEKKKKIESTVLLWRGHRFFFLSLLPWSVLGLGPQRKCPIWNLEGIKMLYSILSSVFSLQPLGNCQPPG